jgi:hypothetical protein
MLPDRRDVLTQPILSSRCSRTVPASSTAHPILSPQQLVSLSHSVGSETRGLAMTSGVRSSVAASSTSGAESARARGPETTHLRRPHDQSRGLAQRAGNPDFNEPAAPRTDLGRGAVRGGFDVLLERTQHQPLDRRCPRRHDSGRSRGGNPPSVGRYRDSRRRCSRRGVRDRCSVPGVGLHVEPAWLLPRRVEHRLQCRHDRGLWA